MTDTRTGFDADTLARLRTDAAEVISRYPRPRSALLPLLHLVQSQEGYVSPHGIELCAELLDLTSAEVAAVATFYTQYKRRPNGDYTVGVCTNTLCAIMGGDQIFDTLKTHLGIGHDETTDDGVVTLEHLECNAACDYAPVVMVNWEFYDNQTPASAVALVDDLRAGGRPTPTRGASLCTFKQVSRVLAGFPDGRADEGPSAGPATLAGLQIYREQQGAPSAEPAADPALVDASAAPAAPKRSRKTATSKRTAEVAAPTTGYGRDGGPSASEAPNSTSGSDPAHPAPPVSGPTSGKDASA